jgi:hypothetical protein
VICDTPGMGKWVRRRRKQQVPRHKQSSSGTGHGSPAPLVGSLADFGATDMALAGGKGANLGELIRAGFPVPAGFIITTSAYTAMLDETGLGTTLAGLFQAGAEGFRIREAFAATPMPPTVRDVILAAYRRQGGVRWRSGPVPPQKTCPGPHSRANRTPS